jgi:hypothetical protein
MRIAEIMVNNEYNAGNKRFYVYVDMDEEKIRGKFSQEMIENAVDQYIAEFHSELLRPYLVRKDASNKKMYDENKARTEVKNRLIGQYF